MADYKHLNLSQRIYIEQSLNNNLSFKAMGRYLKKTAPLYLKSLKAVDNSKKLVLMVKHLMTVYIGFHVIYLDVAIDLHAGILIADTVPTAITFVPDIRKKTVCSL